LFDLGKTTGMEGQKDGGVERWRQVGGKERRRKGSQNKMSLDFTPWQKMSC
jgi:hypothetical protein